LLIDPEAALWGFEDAAAGVAATAIVGGKFSDPRVGIVSTVWHFVHLVRFPAAWSETL
jgi:hypothetical protein